MRYHSKKDWFIIIIIWMAILISVVALIVTILQEKHLLALIPLLPAIGFLLWCYYATYYEFRDTYLYVRCGPFVERIPYEKIVEIKKVSNCLSSMALSTDRILIRRKFAGLTYISPEKRDQFYEELLQRCGSSSKVNNGSQLGPKK